MSDALHTVRSTLTQLPISAQTLRSEPAPQSLWAPFLIALTLCSVSLKPQLYKFLLGYDGIVTHLAILLLMSASFVNFIQVFFSLSL